MPRVHQVRANKDYPDYGIKKGETYYWWEFRYGGKHRSKTPPKPSQLTQSSFLSSVYELGERLAGLNAADYVEDPDQLASDIEEIAGEFRAQAEECESNRSNMPDALQDSETGELLQSRADECTEIADNLEGVDASVDTDRQEGEGREDGENTEDQDAAYAQRIRERLEEIIGEAQGYIYEGE